LKTVQTDGNVYVIKDNDGNTYGTYLTKNEVEARLVVVREKVKEYLDDDMDVKDEVYYHILPLGDNI